MGSPTIPQRKPIDNSGNYTTPLPLAVRGQQCQYNDGLLIGRLDLFARLNSATVGRSFGFYCSAPLQIQCLEGEKCGPNLRIPTFQIRRAVKPCSYGGGQCPPAKAAAPKSISMLGSGTDVPPLEVDCCPNSPGLGLASATEGAARVKAPASAALIANLRFNVVLPVDRRLIGIRPSHIFRESTRPCCCRTGQCGKRETACSFGHSQGNITHKAGVVAFGQPMRLCTDCGQHIAETFDF